MKQINVRLTEADFDRLKARADHDRRSLSNYAATVLLAELDLLDEVDNGTPL